MIAIELHFELTTVGMSRLASAANNKRRPLVPGPLAGVYEKTIDGVPGLSYPVSSPLEPEKLMHHNYLTLSEVTLTLRERRLYA